MTTRFTFPAVLFALCAFPAGCSSEPGGPARVDPAAPARPQPDGDDDVRVRVYVGPEGQQKLLRIRPWEPGRAGSVASGAVMPRTFVGLPSNDPTVEDPKGKPWETGLALLWGAALECGEYSGILPWTDFDGPDWFKFMGGRANTCAESGRRQEALLCVADKLAAAADAVAPTVWLHARQGNATTCTYDPTKGPDLEMCGPWTLPPQPERTRFILRDLALFTLAHVPFADADALHSHLDDSVSAQDCAGEYADAATGRRPVDTDERSERLFGTFLTHRNPGDDFNHEGLPSFPSAGIPTWEMEKDAQGRPSDRLRSDNTQKLAGAALLTKAKTLRAAGDLLRDVVRRSVYSDLAGAERRAAKVAKESAGRVRWGDEGRYNSFAHAARVAAGRWEMGVPPAAGTGLIDASDPMCGGAHAIDLLPAAFGADLAARRDDAGIASTGEASAAQLVDRAGLVVPECRLDAASGATLRAALTAQLAAAGAGSASLRTAFERMAERATDDDLQRAFRRATRTYRMLSGTAPASVCGPVVATAGLALVPAAPEVSAIDGVAVEGGLGRSRLATDGPARGAALLEASQCDQADGGWTPEGTAPVGAMTLPRAMFQDAFHAGEAIRRRLALLRGVAEARGLTAGSESVEAVARAGVGELRAWVGDQIFSATVPAWRADGTPASVRVQVSLPTIPERARTAFAFAYGPAWVAECAARLRSDCPANFDRDYVQSASTALAESAPSATTGVFPQRLVLSVPVPTGAGLPRMFRPVATTGDVGNEHLYVVQRGDTSSAGNRGRVLGTLALRPKAGGGSAVTGFIASPLQRELFEAILGVGKWIGGAPPRIGTDAVSTSASYCIAGMDRDVRLPTNPSVTGGKEPWRHYLDVAKEASSQADALGRDLIEQRLRTDEREESNREQLARVCGTSAGASALAVNADGTIAASGASDSLRMCLSEEKIDLVFLGRLPAEAPAETPGETAPTARTRWLRDNVLLCRGNGSSNPLCTKGRLTTDALGIVAPTPPPRPVQCAPIIQTGASLKSGLSGQALAESYGVRTSTPSALLAAARQTRMRVFMSSDWEVTFGGVAFLDSRPNPVLWPGCMRTGGGCPQSDTRPQAMETAQQMNSLFRFCGAPGAEQAAALGCEGAASGENAERAELNALRWRIQGALFFLGGVTGGVPADMFTGPVPVFDEGTLGTGVLVPIAAAYDGKLIGADRASGVPASYEAFRLSGNPGDYASPAEVPTPDALNTLRTVYTVPGDFHPFPPGAGSEIPEWYRAMYSGLALAQMRHKFVANTEMDNDASGYFDPRVSSPTDSQTPALLAQLKAFTPYLAGMTCRTPSGSPPNVTRLPNEHAASMLTWMARIKHMPWMWELKRLQKNPPSNRQWLGLLFARGAGICFPGKGGQVGGCRPAIDRPFDGPNTAVRALFASDGKDRFFDLAPDWYDPVLERPGLPEATPFAVDMNGYIAADARPPWSRVYPFVNSGAPSGECGAVATLAQAMGLSCVAQTTQDIVRTPKPPPVNRLEDVVRLEGWVRYVGEIAAGAVGRLYVERIPTRVVADFRAGRVGSGAKGGEYGDSFLAMEQALETVPGKWATIASQLDTVANAIGATRLAVSGAKLSADSNALRIALDQLRSQAALTQHGVSWFQSMGNSSTPWGLFANVAYGYVGVMEHNQTYRREQGILEQLASNNADASENAVAMALIQLNQATTGPWAIVEESLGQIRGSAAMLIAHGAKLDDAAGRGRWLAAKASGADVVKLDGRDLPIPVNTVQRRLASATEKRYQAALERAKTHAFLARRAIEQHTGTPLEAVEGMGGLTAPSEWVDDLCSLSGIDYAKIRTAPIPGAPVMDAATIDELAKSFVGDYVQKLEGAVQTYITRYRYGGGNDTAVLSLRSELLAGAGGCMQDAANILYHSGALTSAGPGAPASGASRGWRAHGCGISKCMSAHSGLALAEPSAGPAGTASRVGVDGEVSTAEGVTWLVDDAASPGSPPAVDELPGLVSQSVVLAAGSYVLSWWDQARDDAGRVPAASAAAVPYGAYVLDASGSPAGSFTGEPHRATAAVPWSARRVVMFQAPTAGVYQVAFAASLFADDRTGSVAIANVQLEASRDGDATAYVATGQSRTVPAARCAMTAAELQRLFVRRCDDDGTCHYDLAVPFGIYSEAVRERRTPLAERLAAGNFNYRHDTVAVTVVGRSVVAPNETVPYTLTQDASRVTILDLAGNDRRFDFGRAWIRGGKALPRDTAATFPFDDDTRGRISQDGITKRELTGRPLDGTYTLRLDPPATFDLAKLDDVQLVVRYVYWSKAD